MIDIEFIVDTDFAECRLDKYLIENTSDISRSKIQKIIEGGIELNGKVCTKKNTKLKAGDVISLYIEDEVDDISPYPEDISLDIIYEDDDIIVLNKAKGMVVHMGAGNNAGTLVNALLYHTDALSNLAGDDRPGIVHRLDKDTSGLMVVAKTDAAYLGLKEQLQDRRVDKYYYVIVRGGFSDDEGVIDYPIKRDAKNRLKMSISPYGRPAITRYEVVERMGNYSLLRVKIETGRTHQIRVHMKAINKPVVGDPVYGVKNDKYKNLGQMLHAKRLGFVHPTRGEYVEFETELPEEFERVLSDIYIKERK